MEAPRILIVDDHQLAREGLKAVLEDGGMQVTGLAATGEDAVRMAAEMRPDVILMDVRLGPGIDGLEATRRITALGLSCKILMLTLHEMPAYVREAMAAGAAGYVLKDTAIGDLKAAIFQVLEGRSAIPLELMAAAMQMQSNAATPSQRDLLDMLTSREREVIELISQGMTNKQIARELDISPATVKAHVERIIAKLGVADRTQAAVLTAQARSET